MPAAPLVEQFRERPPRRILVVQTAFLGDTVFTSALVAGLARRFPTASIELCVAPRGRDVAEAMPGAARVHLFDKRGADRGIAGLLRVARGLRGSDLAVLPHRSLRSAALAFLARAPVRLGFSGAPGSLLYTHRARDSGSTFLEREAQLGLALGAEPEPMLLVPRHLDAARALLAGRRAAALCVGSEWATKIWPPERLGDLAALLARRGFLPLLLGGPRERELSAQVAARSGTACLDTTGNPVGEALALLSLSKLCVGGDTGLVHAARALHVPTVALFGPTSPEAHSFGARSLPVSLRLDCAPCSTHGSARCPLGHHRCLRDLDEGRVLAACEAVLA